MSMPRTFRVSKLSTNRVKAKVMTLERSTEEKLTWLMNTMDSNSQVLRMIPTSSIPGTIPRNTPSRAVRLLSRSMRERISH